MALDINSLPLKNIANLLKIKVEYCDNYLVGHYQWDALFNRRFIRIGKAQTHFVWFHELAHAIDARLNGEYTLQVDHTDILSKDYGVQQSLYVRTENELIANRVANILCARFNCNKTLSQKNWAKRKLTNKVRRRINAILLFIAENENCVAKPQIEMRFNLSEDYDAFFKKLFFKGYFDD